jgi:hypothetical protein
MCFICVSYVFYMCFIYEFLIFLCCQVYFPPLRALCAVAAARERAAAAGDPFSVGGSGWVAVDAFWPIAGLVVAVWLC